MQAHEARPLLRVVFDTCFDIFQISKKLVETIKINKFKYILSQFSLKQKQKHVFLYVRKCEQICSTSLPGGNQVDGLPPAPS